MMNKVILSICFTLANIVPTFGAAVMIDNFSFEEQTIGAGVFDTGANAADAPDGWSIFGSLSSNNPIRHVGILNPTGTTLYPGGAPDGDNVAVVFLDDDPVLNSPAGLVQVLTSDLVIGVNYTLTVEVGNIGISSGLFDFSGFPGYRVELLAGGTVIGFDENGVVPGEGLFVERSFSVITTSAAHSALENQSLEIRLINLNEAAGIEVNFDNVRLDATPVPEPSSIFLVGLASIGIAVRRKRF